MTNSNTINYRIHSRNCNDFELISMGISIAVSNYYRGIKGGGHPLINATLEVCPRWARSLSFTALIPNDSNSQGGKNTSTLQHARYNFVRHSYINIYTIVVTCIYIYIHLKKDENIQVQYHPQFLIPVHFQLSLFHHHETIVASIILLQGQ